jgi:hypothetical protein
MNAGTAVPDSGDQVPWAAEHVAKFATALDESVAEVFWRAGFEAGEQAERERQAAARRTRPRPGSGRGGQLSIVQAP